ncbi:MAG: ATP-binding cassette domain-containing protein [Oscillospiraceae bacterium]|nr:ATP-binding cassette domain-containing protein [Oscillospiraceae bacterium]
MDESVSVQLENISKRYRIPVGVDAATKKIDTLAETSRSILGRGIESVKKSNAARRKKDFWALQDINLTIQSGQSIGVIGKNGAGKSTMLKILSRITEPTTGRVMFRGRVAAMLEVGTGFNDELTGRENIYLNGAVLGMRKSEIDTKIKSILDFAELAPSFVESPVKRYSSGMRMRLGFAVAAHLNPDILILDEVLAVGDAKYREKCLDHMRQIATSGKTVIFVSHDMVQVRNLCERVVCLKDGKIIYDGETEGGIAVYEGEGGQLQAERDFSLLRRPNHISGCVLMSRLKLLNTVDCVYDADAPIVFELDLTCKVDTANAGLMLEVFGPKGVVGLSFSQPIPQPVRAGERYRLTCSFADHRLAKGLYHADISILTGDSFSAINTHDTISRAFEFYVSPRVQSDIQEHWRNNWGSSLIPPVELEHFMRL